ncbi:MAG: nucleoside/nucleotide kinase family protein [Pseudomonadota bacterium]
MDIAAEAAALRPAAGRYLLGIAGPPASGKSTLAEALAAEPGVCLLPMDGFHLDDAVLRAKGWTDQKGAPWTFDVAGFVACLARVRAGETVFAARFDRGLELARAGALEIAAPLVIVEGNYLLHDAGGWEAVRPLLDACWYLDVPEEVLRARLAARWADRAGGAEWIEANDLPNARIVAAGRGRADRVIAGV